MKVGFGEILIAEATEDDIDWILEIESEAISPPWTHGALLNEIYRDDSFFAAAFDMSAVQAESSAGDSDSEQPAAKREKGVGLGFVILRRAGDEGELLQIAVCKSARRRGIADKLMLEALGFAKARALKSVFLEVRKSNESAAALYEKHGFKPVRTRMDYYSDPVEDAIVMVFKT